jgi:adenine-specific DNA-methyltransferase
MVHPENDPDQPKTVWKYDPHIDPELMFDSQRGAVEKLIDDALGSDDTDAMRDALLELKRLQEPYLNWAAYTKIELPNGDRRPMTKAEKQDPALAESNGTIIAFGDLTSARVREGRSGYPRQPGRRLAPRN